MASTTLSVTVFGGTAPEDIEVTFYKGANLMSQDFHPNSFTQTFDADDNSFIYAIYVAGKNPLTADRCTICKITTGDISIMSGSSDNPTAEKGKQYLVQYHFTI
jgi:hypothetical protein